MKIKRIGTHDLPVPKQETMDAAGYDLRAAEPVTIWPGDRVAIPCGFAVAVPAGMVGLIWPRSGMAVNKGIDTLAGVVDADYRGELKAVLINHGEEPVQIHVGDRIAQLVVTNCYQSHLVEIEELDATERGAGCFGSTGLS